MNLGDYIPNALRGSGDKRSTWLLIIFGGMLLATIALRVMQLISPPDPVPLLASAEGLVQATSVSDAQPYTETPIRLPADLLGSDVEVVGVYTEDAGVIPAGSVVVVLARDGWRFVEFMMQPSVPIEQVRAGYGTTYQEVQIGEQVGYLIDVKQVTSRCIEGRDETPGVCQIDRALVFQTEGYVISLAGDRAHITDGELIALARSYFEE